MNMRPRFCDDCGNYNESQLKVETRKDNTVICSPIKDSWTKEEISEIIYQYQSLNTYFKVKDKISLTAYIKQWIDENL
jgi:hypothetical protein